MFLETPSPQNAESHEKCRIPRFSRFPGISAHFTGNHVFCENVALAAGRPSKTTNKRQVILGFERRERRGRRFRAKSEKLGILVKSRKFHEIPGFHGISVNPMTSREAKSGKRGAPGGAPGVLGTVPITWTDPLKSWLWRGLGLILTEF